MGEVVEHLPSKHEALSLNCSTTKKKKSSLVQFSLSESYLLKSY
jgi:hypothetical protein